MKQPVGSKNVMEGEARRSSDEQLMLAAASWGHFPLPPSAERLQHNGHRDAGIVRGQHWSCSAGE